MSTLSLTRYDCDTFFRMMHERVNQIEKEHPGLSLGHIFEASHNKFVEAIGYAEAEIEELDNA